MGWLAAIFACSAAILVEGLKASKKRRYSDLEQPAVPAVALELECDGSELTSDSDGGSGGTGSGTLGTPSDGKPSSFAKRRRQTRSGGSPRQASTQLRAASSQPSCIPPPTIDDKGATPACAATPASTPTTSDTSRSGTSNSGTTTGTTSTSDSDIDRDIGGGGGASADGRAEPAPQSPAGVIASLPPHISKGVLAHMAAPERVELALDMEAAGVGGLGAKEKMEEVEEGELESDAKPKRTCAAPTQEVVVLLTDSDFSREGL
ncbi:hypothetical protein ACK3TF_001782 [Chlorella vulgaris]